MTRASDRAVLEATGISKSFPGLPFSATNSVIFATRFSMVFKVIRPGIQPSQYSAARRAEAGVAPPYQNGIGPAGFGYTDTLENS